MPGRASQGGLMMAGQASLDIGIISLYLASTCMQRHITIFITALHGAKRGSRSYRQIRFAGSICR